MTDDLRKEVITQLEHRPTLHTVERLCKKLGISREEIFTIMEEHGHVLCAVCHSKFTPIKESRRALRGGHMCKRCSRDSRDEEE